MSDVFQRAAEIRVVIGYMAEQHAGWVTSQFFGARTGAFLVPVFARTTFQAQCHGVTAAVARLHDEFIGVGRTHHLFRLPEVFEQGIATALNDSAFASELQRQTESQATALARLRVLSTAGKAAEGAVVVAGHFDDDPTPLMQVLAGLYIDAFQRGIRTFPFVRRV
ncbi:BrxE family protein [Variovorax sp. dw_308]|uniref:BrxE family protein n=1 Tax=Variovorax sp. dw_308 TaxID=2721546 RepID=UPI001C44CB64|nr:BrxE family protein [Variovorax sp. dw_308]